MSKATLPVKAKDLTDDELSEMLEKIIEFAAFVNSGKYDFNRSPLTKEQALKMIELSVNSEKDAKL